VLSSGLPDLLKNFASAESTALAQDLREAMSSETSLSRCQCISCRFIRENVFSGLYLFAAGAASILGCGYEFLVVLAHVAMCRPTLHHPFKYLVAIGPSSRMI